MNVDSLPKHCNESESVCASECNSSATYLFAKGDLTQLIANWLYSYIKARLLSTYVFLQLNCLFCSNCIMICGGISVLDP